MQFTRLQTQLMFQMKHLQIDKDTATAVILSLNETQIHSMLNWISSLKTNPSSLEVRKKMAELVLEDRKKTAGMTD